MLSPERRFLALPISGAFIGIASSVPGIADNFLFRAGHEDIWKLRDVSTMQWWLK
jgi:hypothetical protein